MFLSFVGLSLFRISYPNCSRCSFSDVAKRIPHRWLETLRGCPSYDHCIADSHRAPISLELAFYGYASTSILWFHSLKRPKRLETFPSPAPFSISLIQNHTGMLNTRTSQSVDEIQGREDVFCASKQERRASLIMMPCEAWSGRFTCMLTLSRIEMPISDRRICFDFEWCCFNFDLFCFTLHTNQFWYESRLCSKSILLCSWGCLCAMLIYSSICLDSSLCR